MYDGAPKSLSEVAVIGEKACCAELVEIDGKDIIRQRPLTKGFHILPGSHTVTLRSVADVNYGSMTWKEAKKTLSFNALAGHTYLPRSSRIGANEVIFELKDMGIGYDQDCLTTNRGDGFVKQSACLRGYSPDD
ncbi:hypothetical protein [Acinetobacter sp. NRRL B-65365]|uniref:hypothetical protein n=1 Tax=Acinetobacter sp. NRRL B-65365 TaxID=1785092 RepID=UPI0012DEDCD3|nr:hypothetical protein [Acinetobacter sp. NRRL B-65365]